MNFRNRASAARRTLASSAPNILRNLFAAVVITAPPPFLPPTVRSTSFIPSRFSIALMWLQALRNEMPTSRDAALIEPCASIA